MGSSCKKNSLQPNKNIRLIKQLNSKDFGELNSQQSPKGNSEMIGMSNENIKEFYKFGMMLGSGGFATVRTAILRSNPQKKFAVKSISKEKIKGKDYLLLRELTILKKLDHPNIIKFWEIYQDQLNFHIVMEHCDGGELLEYLLKNREKVDEAWIKNIMFQLSQALNYLHTQKICHRDIKPQNILLSYESGNENVPQCKLIDFGLSCLTTVDGKFESKVGTLLYVAPEVLKGNYNEMCDIWALGIVLFVMLSGEVPYDFNDRQQLYKLVKNGKVDWSDQFWSSSSVSSQSIKCLKRMLEMDPSKRITAQELLRHPWFTKERKDSGQCQKKMMKSVFEKIYKNHFIEGRFRREVLKLMVNELNTEEVVQLRQIFRIIDKNGSGIITFKDLQKGLEQIGFADTSDKAIGQLMKNMQLENSDCSPHSQHINYTEFISQCLDKRAIIRDTQLISIFEQFSKKKNYFTKEDLNLFLARKGRKVSQQVVQQMMMELNANSEGKVYFTEFKNILQAQYEDYSCKHNQRNLKKGTFTDYYNQNKGFMKLSKIPENENESIKQEQK